MKHYSTQSSGGIESFWRVANTLVALTSERELNEERTKHETNIVSISFREQLTSLIFHAKIIVWKRKNFLN